MNKNTRSTTPTSLTRKIAAMLAAAGAFTPVVSHAVDGTWTFQSATPATAWTGSWALPSNWQGATIADGVDAIANFNAIDLQAAVTIALDGSRTIGTLNLGDTAPATVFGYTFNAYGNSGRLIFDVSAGNAAINLSSGGLNTSAVTTFNVPLVLNDNLNLNMNNSTVVAGNAVTINGHISGAGILNVIGLGTPAAPSAAGNSGNLTLTGINTMAGINVAGTRVVASAFALGVDNTTTVTTQNGGQLYLTAGGAWKGNMVLGGYGFNENGQGGLGALRTESANNFYYGAITLDAAATATGTARIASNSAVNVVAGTIYGGIGETGGVANLDIGRWANGGAGMLGTVVLASSTGYTGKTYISSGALQIGQNNTVGDINSSSDVVFGFDNKPNNASFTQVASSATLVFNRADNVTFTKAITQTTSTDTVPVLMTGNVTHSGVGNLTFDNGTSGYTGVTTVNSTGGKLTFGSGGAYTFSGLGNIVRSNGGDVEFNTSSTVQIGGGGTVGNTALPATQAISAAVGSHLIQSGTGDLILSGSSDNSGNRAIVNSGTLTLNKHTTATARAIGSNNDLGLIINGGSVVFGADAHADQIFAEVDVLINGGTLDFSGKSEAFDVLTGAGGTVTNTGSVASTLTLGANNSNINTGNATIFNNGLWNGAGAYLSNYGGVITNGASALGVTKQGTGLQTLSGANNYTGNTTVTAGTLSITGSTLSTGAVDVNAGTLSGTGSVGNVTLAATAGSTINAGATSLGNSTGTLTANSLVVNGGTLAFNLGATAGTSDKIAVTTTANFAAASTLTTSFVAPPVAGTYTLLTTAASGLTGTLPTYVAPTNTRYTSFTLDALNTTADAMTLTVVGSNATTSWNGSASNTWDFAATNFTDGGAINDFRNFDVVSFGDGPGNRAPNIANAVSIEAPLTFTNTVGNDYSINITGTGKLTGLTSITKTGNGLLTINGATHDFFGDVNITGGTVQLNAAAGLGNALGQTFISNGATLNLNGQNLGNEVINIAGAGVGGNGALISNGGDNQNALRYLKLTDHATIGSTRLDGAGRFDVRDQAVGAYTGVLDGVGEKLDLNGKTLTKEGMNIFSVVNADMTNGTVNVNRGTFNVEGNTPVRSGTTLNVNPYGTLLYYNPSQNLNPGQTGFQQGTVNLNGGTFSQSAGNNVVASSAFSVSSLGFLNTTAGNTVLNGGISGAGVLVKQGGGILTLNTANAGFTGSIYHLNNNIDIGDGLLLGNVANGLSANGGGFGSGSVTVLNGATLRYNQGTNVTLPSGINLLNGTLRYEPPMHTNTLTINSALGTDIINSTFAQVKGTLNIGAGADVRVGNFLLAGNLITNGNPSITNMSGGTVAATTLNMGENLSGNGTAILNLSGGRINVMGADGGADGSFRVGHWPGVQSQVAMTGGTISVPYATMGIGSDTAQPVFNLSGGTLAVNRLNVDARTGANTSNTLDISGGELMIGVNGLNRVGTLGVVNYRGGKISFWGNNTSNAFIGVEGQREFDTNGFGVTVSGNIQGSGGITKSDNGVLVLSAANNFRGPLNVNAGVARYGNVNATGAGGVVNVANGATLDVGGQGNTGVSPAVRPAVNIIGSGVTGQAALWNSGAGVTNVSIFSQVNMTGNATIGGTGRNDIVTSGIDMGGFTLTKVGSNEFAYAPTATANMGNFVVESGIFTVQSSNLLGGAGTGTVTANPGGEIRSWGVQTNSKPVVLNGGVLASGGGAALTADWTGGLTLTANSAIGRLAQGGASYAAETDRVIRLTGDLILNDNTLTKNSRTGLIIANSTTASNGNMNLYGGTTTLAAGTNMNGGGTVRIGSDAALALDDTLGAVTMAKTLRLAGGLLSNVSGNHTISGGLDISGHGRFAAAAGTTLTLDDINIPTRGGATFDTTGTITPTFINGLTPSGRLGAGYTAGAGSNNVSFAEIVAGNVSAVVPTLNTGTVALSTALPTDDVLNTLATNAIISSDLTIRSLASRVNLNVESGALLRLGEGGLILSNQNHWLQTTTGAQGRITSGEATGELHVTSPTHFETVGFLDLGLRLQVVDNPLTAGGFNPVTLVKSGPGTITKLGSTNQGAANNPITNTFSGGTALNSGRITLENGSGFGLGNVTVRDGGTLLFSKVGTLNQGMVNNLTLSGIGMGETSGILGALRLVNGETSTGSVTLASRTRIHADTLGVVAGKITGASGNALEKTGAGGLFLSNTANTYTGATEIGTRDLAGGLIVAAKLANGGTASSLGSAAATADKLVLDGGTLRYVGTGDSSNKLFTVAINGATIDARGFGGLNLTSTGALAVTAGTTRTLTLAGDLDTSLLNVVNGALPNNTLAATFGDPTHGFVNLTKAGNSIWTLTGDITGNGAVTVANGQLRIGNGGTSGSLTGGATPIAAYGIGNVTLQNQADLIFNRSDDIVVKNQITGADARNEIVQAGAGKLTLGGIYDNVNVALRVDNGTLELAKEVVANGLMNSGRATSVGNQTTGSNAAVVINNGTLRLAGATNADDQIGNGSEVLMRGGTFDMNGHHEIIGRLEGNAGVVSGGGNLEIGGYTNNTGSYMGFGGTFDATAITKSGTNSAVLRGNSTTNGAVTVNQGRLVLGYNGTSGNVAGPIAVNASGTLTANRSDSVTFANAISGAGALENIGSGSATFTGVSGIVANQLVVRRGTLAVGLTGANTSAQILGNVTLDGGRLALVGNASGTSTFRIDSNSIAMNGGNIRVDGNGGAGTELIILNTNNSLVRGTGGSTGTVNFEAVNGGVIRTNAVNPANGYISTGNHAYATYNGNDWAAQVGNSTLGAFTGYVNNTYTANTNTNVTADNVFGGAMTTDTIRFATAAATNLGLDGQTLTLGRGGILNGAAVGANITTVSNGTLAPLTTGPIDARGADTIIHQHNTGAEMVVSGVIGNALDQTLALTTVAASATVTTTATGGMYVGMPITGNVNIPAGAFVQSITNGTTFVLNSATGVLAGAAVSSTIGGANGLVKAGDGVLRLTGANTFRGAIHINGGKLIVGDGATSGSITTPFGSVANPLVNDATLAWQRSDAVTYGSLISGFGEVRQEGTGALNLNAANTFAGGLTVSKGSVITNNAVGFGQGLGGLPGLVTIGDADTGANNVGLFVNHTAALTVPNHITVSALGSGTATIASNNNVAAINAIFTGTVNLNRATILGGNLDRTTFAGPITGNVGTLTIANTSGGASGRVTLEAENTFTGNVVINDTAILQVGSNTYSDVRNQLPDNASVTLNGVAATALQLNGDNETIGTLNSTNPLAEVRTIAGGPSVLTVANGGTYDAKVIGGSGVTAFVLESTGGTLSLGGATDNPNANLLVNGGTVILNKSGAGNRAAAGILTINTGVVQLSGTNGDQLWDGSAGNGTTVILNGGTFDANGKTESFGALNGLGGTVTNTNAAGATLTIGSNNTNSTGFYGQINDGTGALAIVKVGGGNLLIAGDNSFSGGTTISGGDLQVGAGGATGSLGSGPVVNNGVLAINRIGALTIGGAISGSGSFILNGAATVDLTGNSSTFTGPIAVNLGTLLANNNLGTGNVTVNAAGTLGGSGTVGDVAVSGIISPGTLNTGDLNLLTGSTAVFDLDSLASYDKLSVTGSFNIATGVTASFNSVITGGTTSDIFFLGINDGADAITGTFGGLTEGSLLNLNGVDFTVTYLADSTLNAATGGNDFALVVPEPGSAALLLGGLAMLAGRRRRKE